MEVPAGGGSKATALKVAVDTLNGTMGKAASDYVTSDICTADAVCLQEVSSANDQAKAWRATLLPVAGR